METAAEEDGDLAEDDDFVEGDGDAYGGCFVGSVVDLCVDEDGGGRGCWRRRRAWLVMLMVFGAGGAMVDGRW